MKIEIKVSAEGGKKAIYDLKDQLMQVLSNYSCRYDITTENDSGMIETISAVQELRGVKVEDVIDAEFIEIKELSG